MRSRSGGQRVRKLLLAPRQTNRLCSQVEAAYIPYEIAICSHFATVPQVFPRNVLNLCKWVASRELADEKMVPTSCLIRVMSKKIEHESYTKT